MDVQESIQEGSVPVQCPRQRKRGRGQEKAKAERQGLEYGAGRGEAGSPRAVRGVARKMGQRDPCERNGIIQMRGETTPSEELGG